MIEAVGQVMLYVQNPRVVADFWVRQAGFVELGQQVGPEGAVVIEVAPSLQADTTLVLYSRDMVAKYEPELSLGTPSIVFSSRNLAETHRTLQANGVKTGEPTEIYGMLTFNFADNEGNYFAVREIK